MLEVNETTGNPTDFKSPRKMDAQCRKRRRFELETTWPHHKRELKGGFVLKPLDRKGLKHVLEFHILWTVHRDIQCVRKVSVHL